MPQIPATTTEVRLASRPSNELSLEHFEFLDVPVERPGPGQVLVRSEYLGLGAVMRELMNADADLPMPTFQIGAPLWGSLVGTVVESARDGVSAGDLVTFRGPWAGYAVTDQVQVVDRNALPQPYFHLSNGPTALLGVKDIAEVGDGDVVFVSGAAGGVGSMAGQIARNLGAAKVIGSAGSQRKCDYLVDELRFDAAVNYRDGDLAKRLRELAPDGITAFIDLVGGEQFEAAVAAAAPHARFAVGGALAAQQSGASWPRLDTQTAIIKNLRITAFALAFGLHAFAEWPPLFGKWLAEGTFVYPHTLVDGGIGAAPQGLIDLLDGKFTGNVVVRI